MNSMKKTASDKRYEAIRELCQKYNIEMDLEKNWGRAEIAKDIRTLEILGRTDRWKKAIAEWARIVEDTGFNLNTAFVQGALYADREA